MKKCLFRSLVLLALLSPVLSLPVRAAEPYGYWSVATSPEGVKLGLVFPDFSPNEFAGVMFGCQPGTSAVELVVDLPEAAPTGSEAGIGLGAPGNAARYRGRVEVLQPDDRVVARAATTLDDPLFETIATAPSLSLVAGGKDMPLPVRNADKMVRRFLAACAGEEKPRAE